MANKTNLHADRFTARSTSFIYTDEGNLSDSPFVTFEVDGTDNIKVYGTNGSDDRIVTKHVGSVTLFVRTVEDAERILAAAKELLTNVQELKMEQIIEEALAEDAKTAANIAAGLDDWDF